MTDLSLVPTDALWDAMQGRFDHAIFVAFRKTGHGIDEEERRWHGHPMLCVALAMEMVRVLHDWEREHERDVT